MSVRCVVVAAGKGTRAGLGHNKVFEPLGGRSVLSRCLDALAGSEMFDSIALVISRDDLPVYEALMKKEGACPLVKAVAFGGATRRDSVLAGLRALPADTDIVAVHDAARPFVTREIIAATVEAARECGSGVICTPVVDTIKAVGPDGSVRTVDRSTLRAVQTPQTFDYQKLLSAHERAEAENYPVTDDAGVYEWCCGTVRLVTVPGAEKNIKLTVKEDFERMRTPEIRVGSGYDAHRLKEGRKLILCGVEVPHDRGLDGHSDADVAVHALMDAILGAAAMGDIGHLFPDNDDRYLGISSMLLLDEVMRRIRAEGWSAANADVTIVAQKPKLAPHIEAMRRNLIGALGTNAVNVKATTTERMGYEGREEGISAQAAVLLTR